ncbi:hypothetical protein NPIL_23341 [Nephila pilipes]|uniref:Uncharacterized protein n=1 Tax=Nephila pilipes TaxID=299642 RepID=A0A8X6NTX0_NEPPI|nr:hypothetical protein NPIL_23341 [Nephila pilipes]
MTISPFPPSSHHLAGGEFLRTMRALPRTPLVERNRKTNQPHSTKGGKSTRQLFDVSASDRKTFFPLTGTTLRKSCFVSRADAENLFSLTHTQLSQTFFSTTSDVLFCFI